MTKTFEFNTIGGPENLKLVDKDIPDPAADEVQVAIKYTGLNRAELMFLAGQYLVEPALPSKIGLEASGIVKAIGGNVTDIKEGDAVSITPNIEPNKHGVLGEVMNVPAVAIQLTPKGVDFETAAAFWMAYPTAYGGLVNAAGLKHGVSKNVVITAASSSVGIAAIQIAKAHDANVIATTRTKDKMSDIQSVGADHVIVTDDEDIVRRIDEITHGTGFDIAFDAVGGLMIEPLTLAAARDAVIVEYGLLSGQVAPFPFFSMIGKGLTLKTFHLVFDLLQQPERFEDAVEHLLPKLADGTYKPVIDRVCEFENAQDAYTRLASNNQFGKIMIKVA